MKEIIIARKCLQFKGFSCDNKTIKKIANEFAEEFTKKIYYKTLMLKFLPEVKAIERKMSKPR
jgi:hypothetical protein